MVTYTYPGVVTLLWSCIVNTKDWQRSKLKVKQQSLRDTSQYIYHCFENQPRSGGKGENTPFTKRCRQKECQRHGITTGSLHQVSTAVQGWLKFLALTVRDVLYSDGQLKMKKGISSPSKSLLLIYKSKG